MSGRRLPSLPPGPFLYVLTDREVAGLSPIAQIDALAAAAVPVIQLRDKHLDDLERLEVARSASRITAKRGSLLMVNDRADIAVLAGADGVHVGDRDLPPEAVRRLTGGGLLIGGSTHAVEEAARMADKGVDYVAIGPIFASPTKSGRTPLGLATLAEARRRVACPLVAIGGITVERVRGVVEAGADGVAVVSAALAGGRIAEQVAGLLAALDDA